MRDVIDCTGCCANARTDQCTLSRASVRARANGGARAGTDRSTRNSAARGGQDRADQQTGNSNAFRFPVHGFFVLSDLVDNDADEDGAAPFGASGLESPLIGGGKAGSSF
jgi:hypothetical protein